MTKKWRGGLRRSGLWKLQSIDPKVSRVVRGAGRLEETEPEEGGPIRGERRMGPRSGVSPKGYAGSVREREEATRVGGVPPGFPGYYRAMSGASRGYRELARAPPARVPRPQRKEKAAPEIPPGFPGYHQSLRGAGEIDDDRRVRGSERGPGVLSSYPQGWQSVKDKMRVLETAVQELNEQKDKFTDAFQRGVGEVAERIEKYEPEFRQGVEEKIDVLNAAVQELTDRMDKYSRMFQGE